MPQRVEDYWMDKYQQQHGARYRFTRADGVLLRGLMKEYPPRVIAWAIPQYLKQKDDVVTLNGWSVKIFRGRMQGLYLQWVKKYGEPEAEQNKQELSQQLDLMARDPKVVDLTERIGRKT